MKILLVSNLDVKRPYGNYTRPYFLGMELSRFAEVFQLGFDCEGIAYGKYRSVGTYSVARYVMALEKSVREFRPDVIYAQENRPGLCAHLLTRFRGVRAVFDFHASPAFEYRERGQGFRSFLARSVEGAILRNGSKVVLASEYLRGVLKEGYSIVDPGRINVVPNGVPDRMIREAKSGETPYRGFEGKKIILAIIPRNFESNVQAAEFTIRAAERLASEKDLAFVILGGGDALPAPPNVHFTGHVKDVIPYIDWADVCISPYPSEAHCGAARNKLLEFFARRKPVISTTEGIRGIDEAEDGKNVLLAGDTPHEFADFLKAYFESETDPSGLVDEAYSLVERKYNWRKSGENLIRILESV